MKKRFKLFPLLLAFAFAVVTACGAPSENQDESAGEEAQGNKTLVIGMNNWASSIAASNLWKGLLEEKGYEVELRAMEKPPLWIGLSAGDIDLAMEAWLPSADIHLYENYKDDVFLGESWYSEAQTGLMVPTYVDIDSIEDLNANKDQFIVNGQPTIVGIEPGSSTMQMTDNAVQQYDLELEPLSSSEASMLISLGDAYEKEEPIVVTLWNPHWALSDYDLKYLDDPKEAFGGQDDIHFVARKGFEEDHAELVEWLNRFELDDDAFGSLMIQIDESASPEEGAKKWIEDHRDLVESWIN